jgi:hypothetical protein
MVDNSLMESEDEEYRLRIYADTEPESPRCWDNLGTMICFHKNYNLGDNHELKSHSFNNWNELKEFLVKEKKAFLIYPIYLMDHSGLSIRMGKGFRDVDPQGWDSGQIGFIYCTKEDILRFLNIKKIKKDAKREAQDILSNEIKIYDMYLGGEVYNYILDKKKGCKYCGNIEYKHIISCCGFYADSDEELKAKIKEQLEKKYSHLIDKLKWN